jgi:uncharacterized protein (TIGR04255 family)
MEPTDIDTTETFRLKNAPIIEAVIDIDCDMPPAFSLQAVEAKAGELLKEAYPKSRVQLLEKHQIEQKGDEPPKHSTWRGIQALQFLHDDERQLVQIRAGGFSFNRLNPYTSLDDYLPEIGKTWHLFVRLTSPVQIRAVRLRYINRILLPLTRGQVRLEDYVKMSPEPADDKLTLRSFLTQYAAIEEETGHEVNVVVTSQPPENERAPIIFDNCVASAVKTEPQDWSWLLARIQVLRGLKNRVFRNTLTERCLNLFQQP